MKKLHHIGYWVPNIENAARAAHDALGVGPFLRHEHVSFAQFTLADGTEVTDPAYFDHSAAFTAWGDIVLELGEVHSADPHIEQAYGITQGGVSHVSWVVDDLDAEIAHLESQGCALIHTASSGAVNVAWLTGGTLFPHPIEVHLAGPPILGMHARLADLAATWDGTDLLRPMAPPQPNS